MRGVVSQVDTRDILRLLIDSYISGKIQWMSKRVLVVQRSERRWLRGRRIGLGSVPTDSKGSVR